MKSSEKRALVIKIDSMVASSDIRLDEATRHHKITNKDYKRYKTELICLGIGFAITPIFPDGKSLISRAW